MSNEKYNGGPAFPLHNHGAQTLGLHLTGMTLRDYFAAQALSGICAHLDNRSYNGPKDFALAAYAVADAMLEARNK